MNEIVTLILLVLAVIVIANIVILLMEAHRNRKP